MDLKVSRGTQESQEMSLSSEFHMNNTKRNGLFQISRPEPIQFVRKPEDGFTFSLCLCVSTDGEESLHMPLVRWNWNFVKGKHILEPLPITVHWGWSQP